MYLSYERFVDNVIVCAVQYFRDLMDEEVLESWAQEIQIFSCPSLYCITRVTNSMPLSLFVDNRWGGSLLSVPQDRVQ